MDRIRKHVYAHSKLYFGIQMFLTFYLVAQLYEIAGLVNGGWLPEVSLWVAAPVWIITRIVYFVGLLWLTIIVGKLLTKKCWYGFSSKRFLEDYKTDTLDDEMRDDTLILIVGMVVISLCISQLLLWFFTTWHY